MEHVTNMISFIVLLNLIQMKNNILVQIYASSKLLQRPFIFYWFWTEDDDGESK